MPIGAYGESPQRSIQPFSVTKSGRVLRGKPVFFSIPIDFCIEFGNITSNSVLEYTEEIFLTASVLAF